MLNCYHNPAKILPCWLIIKDIVEAFPVGIRDRACDAAVDEGHRVVGGHAELAIHRAALEVRIAEILLTEPLVLAFCAIAHSRRHEAEHTLKALQRDGKVHRGVQVALHLDHRLAVRRQQRRGHQHKKKAQKQSFHRNAVFLYHKSTHRRKKMQISG